MEVSRETNVQRYWILQRLNTYNIYIVVFGGKEREDNKPEHTISKHDSTCICLSTETNRWNQQIGEIRGAVGMHVSIWSMIVMPENRMTCKLFNGAHENGKTSNF